MRLILFIAALGIVWRGIALSAQNPAATVFEKRPVVLVTGYSVGIVERCNYIGGGFGIHIGHLRKLLHPLVEKKFRTIIIAFILFPPAIFLLVGQPVKLPGDGRSGERTHTAFRPGNNIAGSAPPKNNRRLQTSYWLFHLPGGS